ncbi:Replication protein O [Metabacillus sp. Hm71]|uniref:Replication protein O n=1 Tax=Metabacillus sp. Hm71 TaxID=3450743 RepID=UPI003F42777D
MKASHKERNILVDKQEVNLEPGQFVTGRFSLHQEFNQGIPPRKQTKDTTLWSWLKRLEKMGNLDIKSFNKYSVISIVNWKEYQESLTTEPQQNDSKLTTEPQQIDTNKNVNNVENEENGKKNTSRQKFKYESSDMELAKLLFDFIQDNGDGKNKVKNPDMEKWANEIRLIRERDGKTNDQIKKAIDWSQNHHFWKTVILSPSNLRKHYTTLSIKAKEESKKQNPKKRSLFEQGEESKKRQAAIKPLTPEEEERMRQIEEELPY